MTRTITTTEATLRAIVRSEVAAALRPGAAPRRRTRAPRPVTPPDPEADREVARRMRRAGVT